MIGRLTLVALLGAALTGPALAQSGAQQTRPGGAQPGTQAQGTQQGTQQGTPQGTQQQAMSQQQLRRQLEQAGFRDVQVLDAAYLVQARTQDGNTVFMMINPPSGGAQASGMSGSGMSGSGTTGTGGTTTPAPSGSGGGSPTR